MSDLTKKRFDEKIIITPGCWLWKGGKLEKGYGGMSIKNKSIRAHRYSYEFHCGPIPEGMLVLHRCDVPACVNPDHLFLGTNHDNNQDCLAKGRNNPPIGERAPSNKLSVDQVLLIHADVREYKAIAAEYGIHRITVADIKKGRRWKYLNLEVKSDRRNSRKSC